jgi:predicted phage tail protein
MKTVILYGELAKRFGKTHRFAARNAAEVIRALRANCRGFEQFMCGAHRDGVGFKVFVGGHAIDRASEIHNPSGQAEIIRLVPVVVGAGNGWVKIVIGAVLIAASVICPPLGGVGATLISAAGMYGASLIIGGVAQLLTGPPDAPGKEDSKTSHIFSGPANRAAQGKAVPVGYGRMIIGSAVINAGVETYDVP